MNQADDNMTGGDWPEGPFGEWGDDGGNNEGNDGNFDDCGDQEMKFVENEQGNSTMGGLGDDNSASGPMQQNNQGRRRFNRMNRNNQRYNDAYGDYSGGYGPPGPYRGPPNYSSWGSAPPQLGMGYGPRGPPQRYANQAMQYLLRCGVPRENIKNLPRDIFQLIEPEFCGVCSMDLESYQFSRMHYSSKNHLKNQRKWVSLFNSSGAGPFNNREVPLKSRELYCELCDVHITSKVHAESHYSGKQHRAIVLGRKQPKNTLLLHKGMEGRFEQLVRREKKHLKAEDPADGELKDVKPTLPELYCDICQTSVTNSEQMTMHLNGKKHLSKEKQHILKMMKGEARPDVQPSKAPQQPQKVLKEEDGNGNDDDVQVVEDNGAEQTVEDWQNGTGENW